MGDQNKNNSDPNQGMQMSDYGNVSMAPTSQGPVSMTMTMSPSQCIPCLPNLAPAPPHQQGMQTSQLQQLHPGNNTYKTSRI